MSLLPYPMHTSLHHMQLNPEDYQMKLEKSCTLYVGNLSFYTTEEQIYELFSMCGEVKVVIMGLDRIRKTPCGFCFVEYPLHVFIIIIICRVSYRGWETGIPPPSQEIDIEKSIVHSEAKSQKKKIGGRNSSPQPENPV